MCGATHKYIWRNRDRGEVVLSIATDNTTERVGGTASRPEESFIVLAGNPFVDETMRK